MTGWIVRKRDLGNGTSEFVDRTGSVIRVLRERGFHLHAARFSVDGRLVATVGRSEVTNVPHVTIWDWERNEVGPEVPINASSLAFDPSGTRLAVTRVGDGHAEILDTETGAIVTSLSGSTSPLNAVAFSADGSVVVTGGQDGAVRIWDSRTGEERLLLDTERAVWRVGLDPSGRRLLSFDESGVARVWTLDQDELVSIAGSRLTRSLTDAECRRYLDADTCAAANAS